jgi:hypothetical protein
VGEAGTAKTKEDLAMQDLRGIEQNILKQGKVDSNHLELLHRRVYAGGKVGRVEADFLVELHKRVQHPNPAFVHFAYQAIKDHVLADGRIDAEEVIWLRSFLFADGTIKDEERKFLHELNGEAEGTCLEFKELFEQAMKMAQERHTSGSKE